MLTLHNEGCGQEDDNTNIAVATILVSDFLFNMWEKLKRSFFLFFISLLKADVEKRVYCTTIHNLPRYS